MSLNIMLALHGAIPNQPKYLPTYLQRVLRNEVGMRDLTAAEEHLLKHVRTLESTLEQIRVHSNYPGKGRSNFADLAGARRKINKLACDALREEG